jgi:hypothetical protein
MGSGCDWSIELREAAAIRKAHDLGTSGTTSCMDQKQTSKLTKVATPRHPCNVSEWLKLVRKALDGFGAC